MTDITNNNFTEVLALIRDARNRALRNVNKELINLYWQVGKYISDKVNSEEWGKGIVTGLAEHIQRTEPDIKGFSDKNLWRMKQFYETYSNNEKLATLCRELSWSHNRIIFARCKSDDECQYYLNLTINEKYSVRDLERQINTSAFERTKIAQTKLSPVMRELPQNISVTFKDTYIFEFLGLPERHSESDLQKSLVQNLKNFILELGADFTFMGENYRLQVGNDDFYVDLLFYHRTLQCLVAIELKIDKFRPEHMGQLEFYLEALDRDVRKPYENPSIGILLCAYKDNDVVEYALSRSISPTLIADYETKLIPKAVLQRKLHELFEDAESRENN
jgi:predicted nuclease of restriction endonuclease-like (RecB) superfamily